MSDWGYTFVGTELGAPFSVAVNDSLHELLRRGILIKTRERLFTSPTTADLLPNLRSLQRSKARFECLDAACASTQALSPGIIGSALAQEPDLMRVRATHVSRTLLQESAQQHLYEQFNLLRRNLGADLPDLRMPAVVWLTALHRSQDA